MTDFESGLLSASILTSLRRTSVCMSVLPSRTGRNATSLTTVSAGSPAGLLFPRPVSHFITRSIDTRFLSEMT
ncbi:hypothetical protein [Pantoea ananatis]|uniref:hypothetical protein n=1 Tax=Pantoea ananas TaxID=553 RepID=UPI001FF0A0F3|nr:hypothetical protein [Pantoea ananatis]